MNFVTVYPIDGPLRSLTVSSMPKTWILLVADACGIVPRPKTAVVIATAPASFFTFTYCPFAVVVQGPRYPGTQRPKPGPGVLFDRAGRRDDDSAAVEQG